MHHTGTDNITAISWPNSYQNVARLKLHHVHRRLIAPGENMGVLKTKVFLSN